MEPRLFRKVSPYAADPAPLRHTKAVPVREHWHKQIAAVTEADCELLLIFPEAAITRDRELGEFKAGVMKLLQTSPVPVVPMALQNLWGSYFSRAGGAAMSKPFRRGLFSLVGLVAGEALQPAEVTPEMLRTRVAGLLTV
jgi:1-acyl-sn-glycerol-3-phosphate acyltransferase